MRLPRCPFLVVSRGNVWPDVLTALLRKWHFRILKVAATFDLWNWAFLGLWLATVFPSLLTISSESHAWLRPRLSSVGRGQAAVNNFDLFVMHIRQHLYLWWRQYFLLCCIVGFPFRSSLGQWFPQVVNMKVCSSRLIYFVLVIALSDLLLFFVAA